MRRGLFFGILIPLFVILGALGAVTATGALTGPATDGVHADAVAAAAPAPLFSETQHVAFKTPCRIIDTRALGTLIAAGVTRNFRIRGTAGFPGQGGTEGGCGIPQSATAITASVRTLQETAAGFLRIWPFGSPEPSTALFYFSRNAPQSDTANLTLGSGSAALAVRALDGGTRVIVDVWGYDVPPIAARVSITGTLTTATPRVLRVAHTATGQYNVTIDRDVTNCVAIATSSPAEANAFANGSPANVIHVLTSRFTGVNSLVMADEPFDLHVMC